MFVTRVCLLMSVVVGVVCAQAPYRALGFAPYAFTGLSTNRDGSVLLFSSALRIRGASDQAGWEKIFSWTAKDGVRLFAQHPEGGFQRSLTGWDGLEYYHLMAPSISADGQTLALTGQKDCSFGTLCATSVERWQTTVRFADGTEKKIAGSARLSANGRYALVQSSEVYFPDITWMDVRTGQSVSASNQTLPVNGARPVADDGSTVRKINQGLELWRPGFDPFRPTETKPLPGLAYSFGTILLSSDTRVIVTSLPSGLVMYEVATGQTTPIAASGDVLPLDISEDGSALLLRDSRSYRVYRRNSGFRDLPLTGTVNEAVMSGDGKLVFAVVDSSRIVRIEIDTARMLDTVPSTPYARPLPLDPPFGTVARGSLVRISNTALGEPGARPQPLLYGPATGARFGNTAWPVIASDPNGTALQVPWEASMDADPDYLHLSLRTLNVASPFEPAWVVPFPLKASALFPRWFTELLPAPGNWLVAAHEDFQSVVSPSAPARAGEVIHAYGTGFGEVTPPVPTGQPAHGERLSRITGNLQCFWGSAEGGPAVELLFAGLAPGLTGVYQVDFRMPLDVPRGEMSLVCRMGDNFTSARLPAEH